VSFAKKVAHVLSRVRLCIINPTRGSMVRHRRRSAWNGVDSRTNGRRPRNRGLEAKLLWSSAASWKCGGGHISWSALST